MYLCTWHGYPKCTLAKIYRGIDTALLIATSSEGETGHDLILLHMYLIRRIQGGNSDQGGEIPGLPTATQSPYVRSLSTINLPKKEE